MEPTNIIINYLPTDMSDKDLYDLFISYGRIRQHKIIRDKRTGNSLGYGFVVYASSISVEAALRFVNGHEIGGKRLKVDIARPRGMDYTDTNLFVSYLPVTVNESELSKLFGRYGNIIDLKILRDKKTKDSRGMAYVRFEMHASAQKALVELNMIYIFDGATRAISVQFARRFELEAPRLESETEGLAPRLESETEGLAPRLESDTEGPEIQVKTLMRPREPFFPEPKAESEIQRKTHWPDPELWRPQGFGYQSPKLVEQLKILLENKGPDFDPFEFPPARKRKNKDLFPEAKPEIQAKILEPQPESHPQLFQIGIHFCIIAFCLYISLRYYTNN